MQMMMSFSKDGGTTKDQPRRQLILHARDPRLRGALAHYLEDILKEELGYNTLTPDATPWPWPELIALALVASCARVVPCR
jgi:hypothetical protein